MAPGEAPECSGHATTGGCSAALSASLLDGPPVRCAADIFAGYADTAAQISQIWTPSSASQVVERGERAVDDLGAWQRAGQRGDLVEDVSARLLADLLLELSVALYVLAGHGGR